MRVSRFLPSRSSLTSLEFFSLSSLRFLSIILLLSTAALSSALLVQPMFALPRLLSFCPGFVSFSADHEFEWNSSWARADLEIPGEEAETRWQTERRWQRVRKWSPAELVLITQLHTHFTHWSHLRWLNKERLHRGKKKIRQFKFKPVYPTDPEFGLK